MIGVCYAQTPIYIFVNLFMFIVNFLLTFILPHAML